MEKALHKMVEERNSLQEQEKKRKREVEELTRRVVASERKAKEAREESSKLKKELELWKKNMDPQRNFFREESVRNARIESLERKVKDLSRRQLISSVPGHSEIINWAMDIRQEDEEPQLCRSVLYKKKKERVRYINPWM